MVSANNEDYYYSSYYEDAGYPRALSDWHASRMYEHENIQPVASKQKRLLAIGDENTFADDRMMIYMSRHAEEIFEPKKILDDGDWLVSYREPDQRFEYYKQGKGNIKWLSPAKNKIYLFISDNSFTKEQIKQYQKYAEAFFMGAKAVEIIKAGQVIPGQSSHLENPRRVPKDFLQSQVTSRRSDSGHMQYATCGTNGILNRLVGYRPRDSYAMLCITMQDLYPGPRWNFCFGWASYTEGVGAFSFCRYDPAFDGIEDDDREKNLLMRGCAIMCHEIGHQFGLRHCIYYECLMNGINSAEEQRNGGIRILCPVCQKKLKQNLKFDATERFERLAQVCDELGFDEEAAVYRKLIADASESGIKVKSVRPEGLMPLEGNIRGRRATSNDRASTASRANRLVGAPGQKSKAKISKPIWH